MTSHPLDSGFYRSEELRGFGFKYVGEHVLVAKNATIVGVENITILDHTKIDSQCVIIVTSGQVHLGKFVHIGVASSLVGRGGISLGDYSTVSHGCRCFSNNDDYSGAAMTGVAPQEYKNLHTAPIVLEKHCLIGANSVILPGVTLGEGAVVGALSLVKDSLNPWGIYAGTPARWIKARSKDVLTHEHQLRKAASVQNAVRQANRA